MAREDRNLIDRLIETVLAIADGVAVPQQEHLAHKDAVHPHLAGKLGIVPEAPVRIAWVVIEYFSYFGGCRAVMRIVRVFIQAHHDISRQGIVQTVQFHAYKIAVTIDCWVDLLLDEIQVSDRKSVFPGKLAASR